MERLQVLRLSWVVKTVHRMRGRCRKRKGGTQSSFTWRNSRRIPPGAASGGHCTGGEEVTASGEGWGGTARIRARKAELGAPELSWQNVGGKFCLVFILNTKIMTWGWHGGFFCLQGLFFHSSIDSKCNLLKLSITKAFRWVLQAGLWCRLG